MLKTICYCDRCKKEFPIAKAKIIKFEDPFGGEKKGWTNIIQSMAEVLSGGKKKIFCPECVEKIKEFAYKKEGEIIENNTNEHKKEMVEADSIRKENNRDQEDSAEGN